jgi:hypothetical protein
MAAARSSNPVGSSFMPSRDLTEHGRSTAAAGVLDWPSRGDLCEELLVNPALLTLATQRGNIDCGGLRYLIIGYGHFHQLVVPGAGGHVSIAFEVGTNPVITSKRSWLRWRSTASPQPEDQAGFACLRWIAPCTCSRARLACWTVRCRHRDTFCRREMRLGIPGAVADSRHGNTGMSLSPGRAR